MLFDIIFGIFVTGLIGMTTSNAPLERPQDPFQSQMTPPASPFDAPEAPAESAPMAAPAPPDAGGLVPTMMPAAGVPSYIQGMLLRELVCDRAPEPTAVMLALLQENMIRYDERIAYESINCFPIHGGSAVAGMPFDMICASVTDAEAAQLEVVYEQDPANPGYPMLALGTTATDLNGLRAWYAEQFGPERVDQAVVDGLYTPENIPVEVYCAGPEVR